MDKGERFTMVDTFYGINPTVPAKLDSHDAYIPVWRDGQHSVDSRRSMELTGSLAALPASKHILAALSENQLFRQPSHPVKARNSASALKDRTTTSTPGSCSKNAASVKPLPCKKTVEPLILSPLENLPRVVRDMLITQADVLESSDEFKQPLDAALSASNIRSKLILTEVPMSRPRAQVSAATHPRLRDICQRTPNGVVPMHLREGIHPICGIIEARTGCEQDFPNLLKDVVLSSTSSSMDHMTPMLSLYATVKVTNIPWDASVEQIMDFLGKNTRLAPYTAECSPVHFVLDRTSGKTQSDIYLELMTTGDAERFAQRKSGKNLGARIVMVELVSSKEMLNSLFPRYRPGFWLTPEEIQNVLTHAKTFKSPYTRKCPQRPFENFISILALFPWANKVVYAATQTQLLYMGYISIVSILQWHIRKGKIPELNHTLLRRLIIAGTHLTDFDLEQKKFVCSLAGIHPSTELCMQKVPMLAQPMNLSQIPQTSEVGNTITSHARGAALSTGGSIILEKKENRMLPVLPTGNNSAPREVEKDNAKVMPVLKSPSSTAFSQAVQYGHSNAQRLAVRRAEDTSFDVPCIPTVQIRAKSPPSSASLREKWLQNARRAGIAVGESTSAALPR